LNNHTRTKKEKPMLLWFVIAFVLLIGAEVIGAALVKNTVQLDADKTNVLFIHHSTGGNLIHQGRLRDRLAESSSEIALFDHNYNLVPWFPFLVSRLRLLHRTGLSNAQGRYTGVDYGIELNNNDPRDYARIFTAPEERFVRAQILQYDVIVFKKCFPTSGVHSAEQLEAYKQHYVTMLTFFDAHPDKLFLVMTQPPLRAEMTTAADAARARALADWLSSDAFIGGRANVSVFDFFDLLADSSGANQDRLKREYAPLFWRDSHPNRSANEDLALKLAEFVSWATLEPFQPVK